jgi:tetratricopeptide (TPR) repeat protein
MKNLLLLIFITSTFISGCSAQSDCDGSINQLPMYGGIKKCEELIASDKKFILQTERDFPNRKAASKYFAKRGWDYVYQHKLDTAMFRFNQAWMLDSLNAAVYWGFADLMGMQQKFKESVPLFERAAALDPSNARVWLDASTSYGNLFMQTKNKRYLDKSIDCLKNAVRLDPKNAGAYSQLTAAYTYFMQKDSARKYLKITDRLDAKAVNPEVRKMLAGRY